MVKPKRNQKENQEERKENPHLNPSPSEVGLGGEEEQNQEQFQIEADVEQLQQLQQQEHNEEMQEVQRQEEKALHPVLGTVFESNVTKYKGRKTEFLTLPMNLTKQPGYPFKGTVKQKVRITLAEDGSRLIVEKLLI